MAKQVLMVISMMKGGGAERVASLLMNEFQRNGHEVKVVLTSTNADEVICTDLNKDIPLVVLREHLKEESFLDKIKYGLMRLFSSLFCNFFELFKILVPSIGAYASFVCQYHREIQQLRVMMEENPELVVISFLQPSVPMVLLAARGLPNKIIISERDNPKRLMKNRYGKHFVEKYYTRANCVVYQTKEALETYPKTISKKGLIIPNPLTSNLPTPYRGERRKTITTFCRISKQKNLPLLINAFSLFHKEFPDYSLQIIGDAFNREGVEVREKAIRQINELGLNEYVLWRPFNPSVHELILEDMMYVNSSDYEGMSNAMLEAMAIGLPVVCTDCPIGGAHATIQNEVNGLLVPVGDAQAMYLAMKQIIEDEELAQRLSSNAAKLRETLSLENIAKQWMELL